MAQIDASRFLHNIAELFAPRIWEGQEFTVYIDENVSIVVQGDNIIRASGNGNLNSA